LEVLARVNGLKEGRMEVFDEEFDVFGWYYLYTG